MPERGRRVFATQTLRLSKIVDAPLRYVYDRCTDFRPDEAKLKESNRSIQVVTVIPDRLVRIKVYNIAAENPLVVTELIRLNPPNAWHLDWISEEEFDGIDNRLTALGPIKTRVDSVMVKRWVVPKFPGKADWLRTVNEFWDGLVPTIEERYRSGQPAKG